MSLQELLDVASVVSDDTDSSLGMMVTRLHGLLVGVR